MPKLKKRCRECSHFLNQKGARCSLSTGLNMVACDKFQEGRPFRPKFNGKSVQEIDFDPEQSAAWSFWIKSDLVMMLVWDVDHNRYGHFRCFLLGLDDAGVVQKQFSEMKSAPAFMGEIVCKGLAENDIWSSFGYEDEDLRDAEGNLINKPREVKLFPRRDD